MGRGSGAEDKQKKVLDKNAGDIKILFISYASINDVYDTMRVLRLFFIMRH